ncbi:hypothetical protein HYH02_004894 [Chlamydomonas schloesseri]|uniref:SHSP domain-containing protein n=1 Tax=Chlamydomonas schloesseri TaxID=2026947 RepID=A0A835WNZ1_9CHLO|nr:hypothetical protein HYH02_004894 [Chlamydomonas schloesseri]|eukprot:KAG2450391.1 hypothetical protein HYH02_004894 [Chlamydomonas schloesseri]
MALLLSDPFTNEMERAMNRMLGSFGVPVQRGAGGGGAMPGGVMGGGGGGLMDLWKPLMVMPGMPAAATTATSMPMDIIETPAAFELHCDTPGMNPDDVRVELHEGVLTVSGGRKVSREDKDISGKVWRAERSSFTFSRAFTLPDNAAPEGICASMDNGVLKVCIPKKEVEKVEPKRITITGGAAHGHGHGGHIEGVTTQQPPHMMGQMQHGTGGRMHHAAKHGGGGGGMGAGGGGVGEGGVMEEAGTTAGTGTGTGTTTGGTGGTA